MEPPRMEPNSKPPAWAQAMNEDDWQFLRRFVRHSGSLKAVAEEYGVSYPTVRARLDRLIAKLQAAEESQSADSFEQKVKLLVADCVVSPQLARDLITAHHASLKEKS